MADLQELLCRYQKLGDYCDGFWNRVHAKYPDAFACAPGCSTCCELPSVNYLEAYIIAGFPRRRARSARKTGAATGACPFLDNDRCSIYASRPLICRTHGLPLKSEEYSYSLTMSCPFNFITIDPATIDPSLVLEIDKISTSLARLNAAFCLLQSGTVKNAGERILMRDLASGTIPLEWFSTTRERTA